MSRFLLVTTLFTTITFGSSCASPESIKPEGVSEPLPAEVIIVKIPPRYNPTLTSGQNQWLWQEFLFPQGGTEIRKVDNATVPDAGMPNDDSLLTVSLGAHDELSINSTTSGNIAHTEGLRNGLLKIFNERESAGAFEPNSNRILKAVGIKLPVSAKYGDLISVAQAVKQSGADPIVLLLDGHLPETPISTTKKR